MTKMSQGIAEVQSQRAAAVIFRDEGTPIENNISDTVNGENKRCLFLKKLPIELRNEIYKMLLINEDLADIDKLQMDAFPKVPVDFCLSPFILATCRQINEEGQEVLYGMNTFVFDTREDHYGRCLTPVMRKWSPPSRIVTRYKRPEDTPEILFDYRHASEIRQVPALAKVKNWKVIITGKPSKDPTSKFTLLCRALCLNSPKALEVLITGALPEPKEPTEPVANATAGTLPAAGATGYFLGPSDTSGFIWSDLLPAVTRNLEAISMEEALRSLSLLRNLKSFKLRAFDSEDLSSEFTSAAYHLSNETKVQLEATVTGNTPRELLFRIYNALVDYAQAFERYEPFKDNLRESYIEVVEKHTRVDERYGLRWSSERKIHDPYTKGPQHPVEASMLKANLLSNSQDMIAFLKERDAVLEYLEPQYQRIAAAASTTADFIKRGKKEGFFFDPQMSIELSYTEPTELAGAIVALEDYAKAFVRDVPPHTREDIRSMQHEFDMHYSTMPREILLKQMSGWLVSMVRETLSPEKLNEFREAFKAAVDDMDSQYLEIRRARKALFDYDDATNPHPLDLELGRCDEKIDWTVCEPDTEPSRDPQILEGARRWYGVLGNRWF